MPSETKYCTVCNASFSTGAGSTMHLCFTHWLADWHAQKSGDKPSNKKVEAIADLISEGVYKQAPQKPRSLIEIYRDPKTTTEDLIVVLTDYADGGAAIGPALVLELLVRLQPTFEQCNQLLEAARRGVKRQAGMGQTESAKEYGQVVKALLA